MTNPAKVAIAGIVIPPSEEFCSAGLCGQKACCNLEIRVAGPFRLDPGDEEEVYVLPVCEAHALHVIAAPIGMAAKMYPPDESEDPPWLGDA